MKNYGKPFRGVLYIGILYGIENYYFLAHNFPGGNIISSGWKKKKIFQALRKMTTIARAFINVMNLVLRKRRGYILLYLNGNLSNASYHVFRLLLF